MKNGVSYPEFRTYKTMHHTRRFRETFSKWNNEVNKTSSFYHASLAASNVTGIERKFMGGVNFQTLDEVINIC